MDGKAFAWKSVTDSALTAELGRPSQKGITSGKKENLYALVRAKICLNLWGRLERLLLWAKVTDAGNVKWVQLCTALYIMVAAFRCWRTSRVSQPSECCVEVTLENWKLWHFYVLFFKRAPGSWHIFYMGSHERVAPEKFLRNRPSIFIALCLTDFTWEPHSRLSCIKTPRYLWQEIDSSGLLQSL